MRKILIMGLPGAGKTTLATLLAKHLGAPHFNADAVRANINKDLKFSVEDRIEQAKRMGWLCDVVVKSGNFAIADFVCPTTETREAFGDAYIVWVDRIEAGRFEDTNKLFQPPEKYNLRVTKEGSPLFWVEKILADLVVRFDTKKPTALFLGRYQPFHDGHKTLIEEGIKRVGQVCIAVRDTQGTDIKNPFDFNFVKERIEQAMWEHRGKFIVVAVPNITNIFYGRDVGYKIEKIDLDASVENISATQIRKEMQV